MRVAGWLLCCLSLFTGCGVQRSAARPPRTAAVEANQLHPGDTVAVRIDAWLAWDLVLDGTGSAQVPLCGRMVLAGRSLLDAERQLESCLVEAGVYDEGPQVHVHVESGSSITLVAGPDKRSRRAAWEPGMTLVQALAAGLVSAPGNHASWITLQRRGVRYGISVEAIVAGIEPDVPLERGDRVVIEEDVLLGPPPPPSRATTAIPLPEAATLENRTCGQLVLDEVGHRALGMGKQHPVVARIRAAIGVRCADATASASLLDACVRAQRERVGAWTLYGPNHPTIRSLDAQVRSCPPAGSVPAASHDCAELRSRRDGLVAAGLGERHPRMVEVTAELATCR